MSQPIDMKEARRLALDYLATAEGKHRQEIEESAIEEATMKVVFCLGDRGPLCPKCGAPLRGYSGNLDFPMRHYSCGTMYEGSDCVSQSERCYKTTGRDRWR